jgi:hypothetical protein
MAPGISALYGWSSNEFVKRCIPKKKQEGFSTMESSKYETPVSFFESLLKQFSTKISLAMKTLKS